ncbi:MAG: aspartyl protease [Planctomycetes bacterium]|nr:aspartyl protease [Planctomycetota bacterium]MBM4083502.1 aspartyl protease [Planctomycetota bacterium]
MGLTVLDVEVANPAKPGASEKLHFLIDSGVFFAIVPSPVLERLQIRPQPDTEVRFGLWDGSKILRKKGRALFRYGDRAGMSDVVFGEEGDCVLLSTQTLEALGLRLDPLRRELRPLPTIPAPSAARQARTRRKP